MSASMSACIKHLRCSRPISYIRSLPTCLPRGSIPQARTFAFSPSVNLPKQRDQDLHDGDLRSLQGRFKLSNKNFLVTGGARGIGYSAVRAIAEMGGNVCVWDRAEKPAADFSSLADEFQVRTSYIQTDVTDALAVEQSFKQTMAEFDRLDGWYVENCSNPVPKNIC